MDHLLRNLNEETQSHSVTKTLLNRAHATCHFLERSYVIAQAELRSSQSRLAELEWKIQQLTTEIARLNLIINHFIRKSHTLLTI